MSRAVLISAKLATIAWAVFISLVPPSFDLAMSVVDDGGSSQTLLPSTTDSHPWDG
jgi:hypothetical protein